MGGMKEEKGSMTSSQEKEVSLVSIMSGLCQGSLIALLTFDIARGTSSAI